MGIIGRAEGDFRASVSRGGEPSFRSFHDGSCKLGFFTRATSSACSNPIERVSRRTKWRRPYRKAGDNGLLALIRAPDEIFSDYHFSAYRNSYLSVNGCTTRRPQLPPAP